MLPVRENNGRSCSVSFGWFLVGELGLAPTVITSLSLIKIVHQEKPCVCVCVYTCVTPHACICVSVSSQKVWVWDWSPVLLMLCSICQTVFIWPSSETECLWMGRYAMTSSQMVTTTWWEPPLSLQVSTWTGVMAMGIFTNQWKSTTITKWSTFHFRLKSWCF